MLPLHLLYRLSIDGNEPALHHWHQIERLIYARLVRKEIPYTSYFIHSDIYQENIRQFGRSCLLELTQQLRLHQVNGQNQHHACTQRGKYSSRLISWPIEIRQSMRSEEHTS